MIFEEKEKCIEKDIPYVKKIELYEYHFADNDLHIEYTGKIGNKALFEKELIDLFVRHLTPRTNRG